MIKINCPTTCLSMYNIITVYITSEFQQNGRIKSKFGHNKTIKSNTYPAPSNFKIHKFSQHQQYVTAACSLRYNTKSTFK